MRSPSPLALRLSIYYVALFSVTGIQLPFWPLYLSSKGLSAPEIGQLLAAAYLVKIITNPLVGAAADRRGSRRGPMKVLAAISLAATGLFALADGFLPVLLVTLVAQAAFTAMMPLGDGLTMQCTLRRRLDYGRIRLWGSLSFILVASLSGRYLTVAPRDAILWAAVAALAVNLAATFALPDLADRAPAGPAQRLGPLLRSPPFLLFLGCCGLTQASHMIYYGFATLHWSDAGLSGGTIGALWAEGVIAEVVLFAVGARAVRHFGPVRLLTVAAMAGVLRWTVLACTTHPAALAVIQLLHALTFGAGHLGAMHFIGRAAPSGLSARAQGIYSAVVTGIVSGAVMLGSGSLYQSLGASAFLVMAVMSAGGALLALALGRRWKGGLPLTATGPSPASDQRRGQGAQDDNHPGSDAKNRQQHEGDQGNREIGR
ncbi:MAG: MFS transporter [Telmatospirillum sp.]|nr:MFS transporter [Telmatospirillum sp.]